MQMKTKGFLFLFSFMVLLLAVSLACNMLASSAPPAAATPIQQPKQNLPTAAQPEPSATPQPSGMDAGGLKTFTDQKNLYQVQVPGDWGYEQVTGENYYIDQFKSPDEQAMMENVVYDDGSAFTGSQKGKFALSLIYKFYSNDGTSGDIRISGDQIMTDGSERLTWESKSGGYSGASYFETREGKTTFLMLTIEWMNSVQNQYLDTLNSIVESYLIP
jgi:hypothetical protein